MANEKVDAVKPKGEIWIGGDFVVDDEEPLYTQVMLKASNESLSDELDELIQYLNDESTTEQLGCDFTGLVEVPEDDPAYASLQEFKHIMLDEFTANGPYAVKGFPIIVLFGSHE